MSSPPSEAVLAAFGLRGQPRLLAGGEGVVFRVEQVVLKRVVDAGEAEWTQAVLRRVEPDGFRIAEPVAAKDGRFVHDGWSASRFIADLRPAAPAWTAVADAGLRFCDAVERVREGGAEILARRTHRWAVADRVAWGEQQVDLPSDGREVLQQISVLTDAPTGEEHFVHGDLSGNVFLDQTDTPVILDVSPYLRPRQWATAIVVADAVLWNGADLGLARTFATNAADRDLFARALIFRLVAEQLAFNPRHGAILRPYRTVLAAFS